MINLDILKQKKVISYAVLAVIILILDFNFVLKPQVSTIIKATPKIKKIASDIKAFKEDQKNLSQLKQTLEAVKRKSVVLNKKIVQEDELLGLAEQISRIGREENIKITQISPTEDIKAKKVGSFSGGDIYPVMINVNITGGFHQLGKFINRLENLEQFLKVASIEIKFDKQLYTSQKVNLILGAFIARK